VNTGQYILSPSIHVSNKKLTFDYSTEIANSFVTLSIKKDMEVVTFLF